MPTANTAERPSAEMTETPTGESSPTQTLPESAPASLSANPKLRLLTQEERDEVESIRWWHRIPVGLNPDGTLFYTPGEVFHGPDGGPWPTNRFGVPEDLTGRTVLDVGAWDGFFSFLAEERGAKFVLAADTTMDRGGNWGGDVGFLTARRLRGSNVEGGTLDITSAMQSEAIADQYGRFDLVMCYGVLYHLRNPLTAIENLARLVAPGGELLIETAAIPDAKSPPYPAWAMFPVNEGDPTNYTYPNQEGLDMALEWSGFKGVGLVHRMPMGTRLTVRAYMPDG